MSDTDFHLEIPLSTPITHGDKTWNTVIITREPTVGDLAAMDKVTGDVSKGVALVASISGIPIQALNKMKANDFMPIMKDLAPFLGGD